MNQDAYDTACPQGFQSASFLQSHGQLDLIVSSLGELEDVLGQILLIFSLAAKKIRITEEDVKGCEEEEENNNNNNNNNNGDKEDGEGEGSDSLCGSNYLRARLSSRLQSEDIISSLFTSYVPLEGDGKIGNDQCIKGGLCLFHKKIPLLVIGTAKGHSPVALEHSNYGMPSPAGYRKASRLIGLAERFGLPVITLIDTPGAFPSFVSEIEGQPEAIASNLLMMAQAKVPLVALLLGEGGSGGAIGLSLADRIGMVRESYYSVITPEGAASILCRYKNSEEKNKKFQADCQRIAKIQKIYAEDLLTLGVIDEIIKEGKEEIKYNFD
jgi:acetyl-CoA carboxylase carboxyl transferase alpha subunit